MANIWEEFDKSIDTEGLAKDVEEAAENGGRREVPHDTYEVAINKLELTKSKKGDPMVTCWMKIVEGEYKGSLIFMNYLEKTNAIPGVGSTKVTRVWNGDIRPADMIPTAKVKTWYEGIIGTLDQEVALWLSNVYMAAAEKKLTTGGTVLLTILNSDYGVASDTLIQTVQNTIDPAENAGEGYGLAPIGHVVSVKSAKEVTVTLKTKITFDTGYSWSNLQNSIDTAVQDYLLELRKGWADTAYLVVRISQIETRLLSIKGIVDIENTKINGSTDNLTLGKYEVPVFGGASA